MEQRQQLEATLALKSYTQNYTLKWVLIQASMRSSNTQAQRQLKLAKAIQECLNFKLLKWVESDEFETNQPNGVFEEPIVAPVIQEMKSEEIPF